MKRVLLTGANGFIGRHCISYLIEKGYEIHAVSREESREKNDRVIWHKCNLLDLVEQKKLFEDIQPTHILHFAWYTKHKKYWTSIENLKWVYSGLHLLINAMENGCERIVMAGTCAEYDWNYGYCSEYITPLKPSSLYGTCKNSLQEIVGNVVKLYEQKGISYAWGRIFYSYGPFENPARLIPYVINSLLLDKQANFSDGNQIRDFLYVKDTASAFVELLDSKIQGPINISSGQPITLKEVIYNIADILEKEEKEETKEKRHLIKFGVIESQEHDPYILLANVEKLKNELKWTQRYSLSEGLNETVDWWKRRIKI